MMSITKWVFVWGIIAVLVSFFFYVGNKNPRQLLETGYITTGAIIGIYPNQHQTVIYEFKVKQRKFTGQDGVGSIGKNIVDMKLGETVPIYYLPSNPKVSCIGSPEYDVMNLTDYLILSLWISTGGTLAIYFVQRRCLQCGKSFSFKGLIYNPFSSYCLHCGFNKRAHHSQETNQEINSKK